MADAGEIEVCCPESVPTNPKEEIARARRQSGRRGLELYNFRNPFLEEITDPDALKYLIKKWNVVPYAGTTNDSGQMQLMLQLLLYKLSSTHSSCVNKLVKYAVGTRAMFERATDPEYDIDEDEEKLSKNNKVSFRDALKEFFEFESGISKLSRRLATDYKTTGNGWVELVFSETLGVGRLYVKAHKVTNCLYVNTPVGVAREVAISPVWTDEYLTNNPPRVVPLYPRFSRDKGKVVRTIFHLKNGSNDWYGRPDTEGQDLYKYREMQDAIYLIKQASGNFTGQIIIEFEDDDPQYSQVMDDGEAKAAGYQNFNDRFEENYTMKGDDPQSIMVASRPFGSTPMEVFQVKPNTNENWYQVTGDIAEHKIMQGHGCTPLFMSSNIATGFATDIFKGDYAFNMQPVIRDLRNEITIFLNSIITVGWGLLGKDEFNDFSITFKSPIDAQIENEEIKNDQATQTSQAPKPTTEPNNPGNPT